MPAIFPANFPQPRSSDLTAEYVPHGYNSVIPLHRLHRLFRQAGEFESCRMARQSGLFTEAADHPTDYLPAVQTMSRRPAELSSLQAWKAVRTFPADFGSGTQRNRAERNGKTRLNEGVVSRMSLIARVLARGGRTHWAS